MKIKWFVLLFMAALTLSLSTLAFAFFGTVVTPCEVRIAVLENGKPVAGHGVALHSAAAGTEAYWPWRVRHTTDEAGHAPMQEFSRVAAGSMFTKRLSELSLLMAIAGSDGKPQFFTINIEMREKKPTIVKVSAADLSEFNRFSLVKPQRTEPRTTPHVQAQSTAIDINGSAGWRIELSVDIAL